MLNLLPHIKPSYMNETDNSLLEEAASEFRRITDAADLGRIGQGLCRDGDCQIAENFEVNLKRMKVASCAPRTAYPGNFLNLHRFTYERRCLASEYR